MQNRFPYVVDLKTAYGIAKFDEVAAAYIEAFGLQPSGEGKTLERYMRIVDAIHARDDKEFDRDMEEAAAANAANP